MQEFVVATALIVMSFVLVACTALQRVPYKDDEQAAYRTYWNILCGRPAKVCMSACAVQQSDDDDVMGYTKETQMTVHDEI